MATSKKQQPKKSKAPVKTKASTRVKKSEPSKAASQRRKRKVAKKPPYRPLKFQSIDELQRQIEAYFRSCNKFTYDNKGNRKKDAVTGEYLVYQFKVPTITGLAVFLDTSRETLLDYENELHKNKDMPEEIRHGFSDAIKKAKLRIYDATEQQLYCGKPTGAIFSLKNNYGWEDKTKVETRDVGHRNPFENLSEDELRRLAGEMPS